MGVQIDYLDKYWQRRQVISEMYNEGLAGMSGAEVPDTTGKSARHLYTIWVGPDKRDTVLHMLQDNGIGVAVNYRAIHTLTYFRECFGLRPEDFPVADLIGRRTLTLPLYPGLKDNEVKYVIGVLGKILEEIAPRDVGAAGGHARSKAH